jgi:hypothetical protein
MKQRGNITGPDNGPDTKDFTKLKKIWFGTYWERIDPTQTPDKDTCGTAAHTTACVTDILTAKRQIFHYAIWGHEQLLNWGSSGRSEVVTTSPWGAANDMLISLGAFSYQVGSVDQQEATFMHELGHNLDLGHGGPYAGSTGTAVPDSSTNCKPNYLSVMSWSRQFSDLFPGVGRPLNYSGEGHVTGITDGNSAFDVNESPISPENPVTYLPNSYTVFNGPNGQITQPVRADLGIDWDLENPSGNVGTQENGEGTDTAYIHLHNLAQFQIRNPGGPSNQQVLVTCPTDNYANPLYAWNDWNNLRYDMTASTSFNDGAGGAFLQLEPNP